MTSEKSALENIISSRKNAMAKSTATVVTGDIVKEEKEEKETTEKDHTSDCQD